MGWGESSRACGLWRGQGLTLGRTFKLHVNTLKLYYFSVARWLLRRKTPHPSIPSSEVRPCDITLTNRTEAVDSDQ